VATTLSDIRFEIERFVKDTVENVEVIDWCNDAQIELLAIINLPDTVTIPVNTSDISYPFTSDVKRINRMWMDSEREAGVDRDIPMSYRIYNEEIIFHNRFDRDDTLHIDFYRHLTYFTDINDLIDIDDRFKTLYTSYGIAQYYDNPQTIVRIGENLSSRQYEKHYGRHMTVRDQIAAQYITQIQPSTIKEAW
jgi:hypothetical protein